MSFLSWISKDPMQRTLYILVPLAHIALFIGFFNAEPPQKNITKKLVVKTFTAAPPSSIKTQVASVKNKAPPVPLPAKQPPIKSDKKENRPSEKKQVPIPKKGKTIQIKKEKPFREDLLKELEERIAKIDVKSDRMAMKPALAVPSTPNLSSQVLKAPKELQSSETYFLSEDFISSLIGYLQTCLHLPELGEVQIELSLNKEGKVKNMKVTKSESQKNKKYLEEEIPKLSFPQIYLDSASSPSFLFTFCNKF